MNSTKLHLRCLMVILFFSISDLAFSQTENQEYATIHFYRVKESMMSGGQVLEAKIKLNNQEIGTLLTNTKLQYKLYSTGTIKIRCAATYNNGGIGAPFIETIQVEKGKVYHIGLSLTSMKGVIGEILKEKKIKEMKKVKFSETLELQEDKATPIALSSTKPSENSADNKEAAIIHIYRVQESMMSGGRGLEAKIELNGKEVSGLLTNTKLQYKLYSTGSIKIRCVATFGGNSIGSPFVKTIPFEKGKEYHIGLSLTSMKGTTGEILKEKKIKEMKKVKFSEELVLEENLSDPIPSTK